MKLYCATTNPGKLREFRLAASTSAEIEPLPDLASIAPCEETGSTFEDNAIQKALYYGAYCSSYLFAEDSGLEVDSLGGAPGVFSARFAGADATDERNNSLLLEKLAPAENRTARYVCVIALASNGRLVRTFRGEVQGQILREPRGAGGFGYDPFFYFEPLNATFAEISPDQKQSVSHRGHAMKKLMAYMQSNTR